MGRPMGTAFMDHYHCLLVIVVIVISVCRPIHVALEKSITDLFDSTAPQECLPMRSIGFVYGRLCRISHVPAHGNCVYCALPLSIRRHSPPHLSVSTTTFFLQQMTRKSVPSSSLAKTLDFSQGVPTITCTMPACFTRQMRIDTRATFRLRRCTSNCRIGTSAGGRPTPQSPPSTLRTCHR
jgi:hypothetical protein